MKKVRVECPECKRIFEHEKQAVANRILGTHRFGMHGVPGVTANKEGQRFLSNVARLQRQGMSKSEAEKRANELELRYREREARQAAQPMSPDGPPPYSKKKHSDAQPMEIDRCPKCKTSFSCTLADGNKRTMELTYCPICKLRFWFTE